MNLYSMIKDVLKMGFCRDEEVTTIQNDSKKIK